jgi:DNA polymerase III subunit beta
MQFSCNQDTFAKYLNIASRIVTSKPGLPILNNVLFRTEKGKLLITVTDLEISLNTWIGADVQAEGSITVPAKQLSEFINSVSSEKIDIVLNGKTLNIKAEGNIVDLNTMSPEDYPSIPSIKGNKAVFKINKDELVKTVNRVAFAAATDDIKPVLTGVKIEVEGDTASFVATDGLRLSRQIIKLEEGVEKNAEFLIPVKALQELAHIINDSEIGEGDDFVQVFYIEERNQVLFRFNDIDIMSRLIDGKFPEYKQIIPTGSKTKCLFGKEEFLSSLKVTNIIARTVLGNKLILDIDAKKDTLTMSATQSDVGSNKSSLEGSISGDNLQIAFSARLLSDILNHINDEKVSFECSESVKPGVFKIEGDKTFIHLVMPMML